MKVPSVSEIAGQVAGKLASFNNSLKMSPYVGRVWTPICNQADSLVKRAVQPAFNFCAQWAKAYPKTTAAVTIIASGIGLHYLLQKRPNQAPLLNGDGESSDDEISPRGAGSVPGANPDVQPI